MSRINNWFIQGNIKKKKNLIYGEESKINNVHRGDEYGSDGNFLSTFLGNIYYEGTSGLGQEDVDPYRNFTQSFLNGTGKDINFKIQSA